MDYSYIRTTHSLVAVQRTDVHPPKILRCAKALRRNREVGERDEVNRRRGPKARSLLRPEVNTKRVTKPTSREVQYHLRKLVALKTRFQRCQHSTHEPIHRPGGYGKIRTKEQDQSKRIRSTRRRARYIRYCTHRRTLMGCKKRRDNYDIRVIRAGYRSFSWELPRCPYRLGDMVRNTLKKSSTRNDQWRARSGAELMKMRISQEVTPLPTPPIK